ncbi:MAG: hypothetical protein OEV42_10285 [Deltaproteobacteria bacterium]|nr:hypothetical protein [Deltaproteobacteria bacterium]
MITKQDIAIILIRVLAAYMLLQALAILPMSVLISTADPVMFLISHEFTTFVISTILWFSAPRLSKVMVKDSTNSSEHPEGLEGRQVESLIFSTIGVILVAVSIPALANMVAYHRTISTFEVDAVSKAQMVAGSKGFITKYIVKIAVGIFLIFFSEKLCHLLSKGRNRICGK